MEDTVDLMLSEDWVDRLIAEYVQANIRLMKLCMALENMSCSNADVIQMHDQRVAMEHYIQCLKTNMIDHGIDIPGLTRKKFGSLKEEI